MVAYPATAPTSGPAPLSLPPPPPPRLPVASCAAVIAPLPTAFCGFLRRVPRRRDRGPVLQRCRYDADAHAFGAAAAGWRVAR